MQCSLLAGIKISKLQLRVARSLVWPVPVHCCQWFPGVGCKYLQIPATSQPKYLLTKMPHISALKPTRVAKIPCILLYIFLYSLLFHKHFLCIFRIQKFPFQFTRRLGSTQAGSQTTQLLASQRWVQLFLLIIYRFPLEFLTFNLSLQHTMYLSFHRCIRC